MAAAPAVIDAPLLDTLAEAQATVAADADAAFTPERAAAQRALIMARLGATDDPRVLSFPPRADVAPTARLARAPRPALGWMLTAAAAGLVVGVGTGQGIYLEWPARQMPAQARVVSAPVRTATAVIDTAVFDTDGDDAILGEVEVALSSRGVDELQPLDALTPRVTLVASR
ncbi:MAG: hypothetical protein ABIU38_04505 [Vicinamibacteraceae bacterium]